MIFLGAPGVGKGTQADIFAKELGIPHISTGDILREAVARGTELGLVAKGYMEKGELVPDEIVIGIIQERISEPDCKKGCIFDGFPRTVTQAAALDKVLAKSNKKIDYVINIEVDEEEIVRRLSGRRSCAKCGRIYHLLYSPPVKDGICNDCGGELYQRDDDREEVIRNRLRVYNQETVPLISYYRKKSVLRNVEGKNSVEEVTQEIERVLKTG